MKTLEDINAFCQQYQVQAFEYGINRAGENTSRSRMVVLVGGFGQPNPRAFMDGIVSECVSDGEQYNEYVEETMDNPWIRILVSNMNNLINE